MVSSAKLPHTVPKVNSKWDGVPGGVARREKERRAAKRGSHKAQAKLLSDTMTGGASPRSRSSSRTGSITRYGQISQNSVSSFGTRSMTSASAASSTPDLVWTPASLDPKDFAGMLGNSTTSGPSTPLSEVDSFISYLPDALRSQEEHNTSGSEDLPELPKLSLVNTSSTVRSKIEPLLMTPQHTRTVHSNGLLTPESATTMIASDIQTTTLNVPSSKQVMLKSSGVNVLGPPVRAQKKVKALPSSAEEAQGSPAPSRQVSILKKDSTPPRQQGPMRPAISSYSLCAQSQGSARRSSSRKRVVAPWDSPESIPILTTRNDAERSLTPTPQESKGKSRKGKLSLFRY